MSTPTQTKSHPKRWLILVVLCLATFVLVLDNFVLTTAIPSMGRDIGADAQDIQWIIDSYLLVFVGLLLTAGSLSDRFGRRRLLLIGLLLFGAASLFGTFAESPDQVILARVFMGIGGSLVMPSTLSILITVFDDEERRKATAIWSTVLMLGTIGGPTLGGWLVSEFWWGVIFLINVPIVVVSVLAALAWMPESRGPWRKPDPMGAILSMIGMAALVWTVIELPRYGLSDDRILIGAGIAVVSLLFFGIWEAKVKAPMVPLGLFRNRSFSGGSLALVLIQLGTAALMLVLPQYFQYVLGYSPMESGMAITPMLVATILGNLVSGGLGMKFGNRQMATVGGVVVLAGFVVLAGLGPDDSYGVVATALGLIGLGSGLAFPAAVAALMGAVPEEHAGVGSALNDTVQQSGATLGVAVLGTVLAGAFTSAMPQDAPEQARQSISGALNLAGTSDPGLAASARDAFVNATSTTFTVACFCSLAAILTAVAMIRDKKKDQEPEKTKAVV